MSDKLRRRPVWAVQGTRFAVVPYTIARSPNFTLLEKGVILSLCAFQNTEGRMWPLQKTVAKDIGCDVSSVRRAIRSLETKGMLRRKYNRASHQIVYQITWDLDIQATADAETDIPSSSRSESTAHQYPVPPQGTAHQYPVAPLTSTLSITRPLNTTSSTQQDQGARFARPSSFPDQDRDKPLANVKTTQKENPDSDFPTTKMNGDGRMDALRDAEQEAGRKNSDAHQRKLDRREAALQQKGQRERETEQVVGGTGKGKKDSQEVLAVGGVFIEEYKRLSGVDAPLFTGKERGQTKTLAKRLGVEGAQELVRYVFSNWGEVSRLWRATGAPNMGVILTRGIDLWPKVKAGKNLGFKPPEFRDEKEQRLQRNREAAYADPNRPTTGWT